MATHTDTMRLRLSPELKERAEQRATEAGGISEYIRGLIERDLLSEGVFDPAADYEAFARVGGKLVPVSEVLSDVVIQRRQEPVKKARGRK